MAMSAVAMGAVAMGAGQTIGEFLRSGGELMLPLGLCSILVVGFFLERLLAIRRRRVCPPRIDALLAAIVAGRFGEVRDALGGERSAAGRILAAGVRRRGYPLRDVEGAMEDQARKELEKLRHNVRPLVVIGAVAPLLGLLGTVLGIAEAFRRVSQTGMGRPEMLAGGIEMALTTTIAGLSIAIPAVLGASWLQGRVRRVVLFTDEKLAPVVEVIAHRPETVRDTERDAPVEPAAAEEDARAARAG
ncbi:MAG: MotA/TolQ/ExbB proton channel family protein [Planctomycetes bacterium]|nr:MotA/TolQ/ExbB proton channel family protein [Planctomycetota bacterium]